MMKKSEEKKLDLFRYFIKNGFRNKYASSIQVVLTVHNLDRVVQFFPKHLFPILQPLGIFQHF